MYARAVDPARTDQGTVWIIEDITEAKRTSEALGQTLREMQAILANAPVDIEFVRGDRIVRYNRQFGTMFGFEGDAGIGLSPRVLYR